jgi:hypothetical protein
VNFRRPSIAGVLLRRFEDGCHQAQFMHGV